MSGVEDRLAALEAEVRGLRDQLAIYQLLATYGPGVDSASATEVAELWVSEGVYDTDSHRMEGRGDIVAMVEGPLHQGYINNGAAHVVAMPHVVIDGDTAVATGNSRLYLRDGDGFRVARISANRWELQRTPEGWRVVNRLNRMVDGSPEVRAILGRGVRSEGGETDTAPPA